MQQHTAPTRARRAPLALAVALLALLAPAAQAQTDYYNTDAGRPIRVEDPYPTERYAFDLHLAPLTLERSSAGTYAWEFEPEIAYGVLPRTQLELGIPVVYQDAGDGTRTGGLAGLELTALYNFNVETRTLPAFGVRAGALLPVGHLAPDRAYPMVKGIMTRTFSRVRFHVNGGYTFGDEPGHEEGGHGELSRWFGGVAIDHTFPLRSLLITAETYTERPMHEDADLVWSAGAGLRKQLTPMTAIDAGIGRRLTGDDRSWFVTAGVARVLGVRALFPVR